MNIKTTLKTDTNKGTQKILAKGGGKQKTVPATSNLSEAGNHGNAAGTLALILGLKWSDSITHTVDGDVHTFTWK